MLLAAKFWKKSKPSPSSFEANEAPSNGDDTSVDIDVGDDEGEEEYCGCEA